MIKYENMKNKIIIFSLFTALFLVLLFAFYGLYALYNEANIKTFLYSCLISFGIIAYPLYKYVSSLK